MTLKKYLTQYNYSHHIIHNGRRIFSRFVLCIFSDIFQGFKVVNRICFQDILINDNDTSDRFYITRQIIKFSTVNIINSWLCSVKSASTYLIGHYNPSVRIIDIVSHTTYVVCVNFVHKCRDLQFKVDYERFFFFFFFEKLFIAILFTLRVFA